MSTQQQQVRPGDATNGAGLHLTPTTPQPRYVQALSQLLRLSNIAVATIGTYLYLIRLARKTKERYLDIRNIEYAERLKEIAESLVHIANAVVDAHSLFQPDSLHRDCLQFSSYRSLLEGVTRVIVLIRKVVEHAEAFYDANPRRRPYPPSAVSLRMEDDYEGIVKLQHGRTRPNSAWRECVEAMRPMLEVFPPIN